MRLLFIGRNPLFRRKRVVGRCRAIPNVASEAGREDHRLVTAKDAKHVFHKRSNLVCFALFLGIDVLQVRDHVHDFVKTVLHLLFLLFELDDQLGDIIDRTLAVGALRCRLENVLRLFIAQDDIMCRGRSKNLKGSKGA